MYKAGKTTHTISALLHFRTICIENAIFKIGLRIIRWLDNQ